MPNLFLPCGTRLQPPLRRDAVRKLLAEQTEDITWLFPQPDGSFIPESLPDHVFRPLSDWVDYVLDHDRAALQTWVEATQFDFDSFICKDDQEPTPDKPKKPVRDRRGDSSDRGQQPAASPAVSFQAPPKKTKELDQPLRRKRGRAEPAAKRTDRAGAAIFGVCRAGRCGGPASLVAAPGGTAQRLVHGSEAMICWANALWYGGSDAPALARHGSPMNFRIPKNFCRKRSSSAFLGQQELALANLHRLAACAIAAPEHPHAGPLHERLADVQQVLQRRKINCRCAWSGWPGWRCISYPVATCWL